MSLILISLFNTRFCSHLFSFYFFFFKNKLYIFTCDPLFSFWISELNVDRNVEKYHKKNSQVNDSLRENVSIFLSYLLALISSRNVVMRRHFRKGIVLLKYQYFRFRIKAGAHFEILN